MGIIQQYHKLSETYTQVVLRTKKLQSQTISTFSGDSTASVRMSIPQLNGLMFYLVEAVIDRVNLSII